MNVRVIAGTPITHAISASGRHVSFHLLHWLIEDLYEFQWCTRDEFNYWGHALVNYERHNTMPGACLFRSPLSNEMIPFVHWIDDLEDMWVVASVTEGGMQEEPNYVFDAEDEEQMDREVWNNLMALPVNVGRYNNFVGGESRYVFDLTGEEEMSDS